MNIDELTERFKSTDLIAHGALIEFESERGIALLNAQIRFDNSPAALGDDYLIFVFWEDGSMTLCPDEFELIKPNIWR